MFENSANEIFRYSISINGHTIYGRYFSELNINSIFKIFHEWFILDYPKCDISMELDKLTHNYFAGHYSKVILSINGIKYYSEDLIEAYLTVLHPNLGVKILLFMDTIKGFKYKQKDSHAIHDLNGELAQPVPSIEYYSEFVMLVKGFCKSKSGSEVLYVVEDEGDMKNAEEME